MLRVRTLKRIEGDFCCCAGCPSNQLNMRKNEKIPTEVMQWILENCNSICGYYYFPHYIYIRNVNEGIVDVYSLHDLPEEVKEMELDKRKR